jgi:hypothetical protein
MLHKVLIGAGLSLCLVACASGPKTPDVAKASAATSVKQQPGCVETGSRIPNPNDCAGIVRAYNQQDIRTTGETDAAQAIRMLDSAVTLPGR